MFSRLTGLLMASLSVTAFVAHADEPDLRPDRWYVAAGGTVALLKDVDQTIANAPMPGATVVIVNESDTGWGGYAALGRRIGKARIEIEYGRTENDSSSYDVISPAPAVIAQDSETDISRYMVNAYYDVSLGSSRFAPYAGAGIGAATIDNSRIAGTFGNPTPRPLIDDSTTDFVWQAMAGLSVRMTPNLEFTTQYRWFDAGTVGIEDLRGEAVTLDIAGSHFEFGIRYAF